MYGNYVKKVDFGLFARAAVCHETEWFDYRKFDIAEYEHYEKIENRDLNCIIPGKFIALSSPLT